jgi:hypothetical protein
MSSHPPRREVIVVGAATHAPQEEIDYVDACSVRASAYSEIGARDVSLIFDRDTLGDVKPSFEGDTDIVTPPPHKPTFCNCKKAVERDVEVYRKKT